MDTKLWEQIDGNVPPEVPGEYITNLGNLKFDGETFIMSGHTKRIPTTVEWWLKPYIQ